MKKICGVCGSEFEPKNSKAKYCCKKCCDYSRHHDNKSHQTFEEIREENETLKLEILKWYKKGKKDKEIAERIGRSVAWVQKTRNAMGLPRQGYNEAKKREAHRQELAQIEVRFCKRCGSYFYPIRVNQIYCTKACEKRANSQVNDIKRKRRVQDAYIDDIDLQELYRKENGICYLCGGQCDWNDVRYSHGIPHALANYPSREHIKPLSKGGLHSWDNVRLAHIRCNSSKGVSYG